MNDALKLLTVFKQQKHNNDKKREEEEMRVRKREESLSSSFHILNSLCVFSSPCSVPRSSFIQSFGWKNMRVGGEMIGRHISNWKRKQSQGLFSSSSSSSFYSFIRSFVQSHINKLVLNTWHGLAHNNNSVGGNGGTITVEKPSHRVDQFKIWIFFLCFFFFSSSESTTGLGGEGRPMNDEISIM